MSSNQERKHTRKKIFGVKTVPYHCFTQVDKQYLNEIYIPSGKEKNKKSRKEICNSNTKSSYRKLKNVTIRRNAGKCMIKYYIHEITCNHNLLTFSFLFLTENAKISHLKLKIKTEVNMSLLVIKWKIGSSMTRQHYKPQKMVIGKQKWNNASTTSNNITLGS